METIKIMKEIKITPKFNIGDIAYVVEGDRSMRDWMDSEDKWGFAMRVHKATVKAFVYDEDGVKYHVTEYNSSGEPLTHLKPYPASELLTASELETRIVRQTVGVQVFNHKYEKAKNSFDVANALRDNGYYRDLVEEYVEHEIDDEQSLYENVIGDDVVNWEAVFSNSVKFDRNNHIKAEKDSGENYKEVARKYVELFEDAIKTDTLSICSLSASAYGRARAIVEGEIDEVTFEKFMEDVVLSIDSWLSRLADEHSRWLSGDDSRTKPLMRNVFEIIYESRLDVSRDDFALLDDNRWYVDVDRVEEFSRKI